MSKVFVVFGATGQQGSSVVQSVISDPELSKEYKVRAVTRNVDSEAAKKLAKDVEVVQGDVHDRASVEKALTGAHAVFLVTTPAFDDGGREVEYNSAKTVADVAVEKGAELFIFSTLTSPTEVSGGKYTKVLHFDAKAKAEAYIRGLKIKSAFVALGGYFENYAKMPFFAPQPNGDGTYSNVRHLPASSETPLVCATGDTGKFVGAILAEPGKYEGKTFCAATRMYTNGEVADIMSKATGKKIVHKEVPADEWIKSLPFAGDLFYEAFQYGHEFGFYGPNSKEKIQWSVNNMRGKPTELEDYFKTHPLQLA